MPYVGVKCDLHECLKGGQSSGTEPSACGTSVNVGSVRTGLSCWMCSWCWRIETLLVLGKARQFPKGSVLSQCS